MNRKLRIEAKIGNMKTVLACILLGLVQHAFGRYPHNSRQQQVIRNYDLSGQLIGTSDPRNDRLQPMRISGPYTAQTQSFNRGEDILNQGPRMLRRSDSLRGRQQMFGTRGIRGSLSGRRRQSIRNPSPYDGKTQSVNRGEAIVIQGPGMLEVSDPMRGRQQIFRRRDQGPQSVRLSGPLNSQSFNRGEAIQGPMTLGISDAMIGQQLSDNMGPPTVMKMGAGLSSGGIPPKDLMSMAEIQDLYSASLDNANKIVRPAFRPGKEIYRKAIQNLWAASTPQKVVPALSGTVLQQGTAPINNPFQQPTVSTIIKNAGVQNPAATIIIRNPSSEPIKQIHNQGQMIPSIGDQMIQSQIPGDGGQGPLDPSIMDLQLNIGPSIPAFSRPSPQEIIGSGSPNIQDLIGSGGPMPRDFPNTGGSIPQDFNEPSGPRLGDLLGAGSPSPRDLSVTSGSIPRDFIEPAGPTLEDLLGTGRQNPRDWSVTRGLAPRDFNEPAGPTLEDLLGTGRQNPRDLPVTRGSAPRDFNEPAGPTLEDLLGTGRQIPRDFPGTGGPTPRNIPGAGDPISITDLLQAGGPAIDLLFPQGRPLIDNPLSGLNPGVPDPTAQIGTIPNPLRTRLPTKPIRPSGSNVWSGGHGGRPGGSVLSRLQFPSDRPSSSPMEPTGAMAQTSLVLTEIVNSGLVLESQPNEWFWSDGNTSGQLRNFKPHRARQP